MWGFALLILSNVSLISHENEIFGLTETKLFDFNRILKKQKGRVSSRAPSGSATVKHHFNPAHNIVVLIERA